MQIKIKGENLIVVSLYLLIFYLCLPISMTFLNSLLIHLLVFFSAALFVFGLILMNKWLYLVCSSILLAFAFFYWILTWRVQLESASFVYYCFASLVFVFSGIVLYTSGNMKTLRRLFLYITLIYFVTEITTIFGLELYPLAARELGRGATYDTSMDFAVQKSIYRRMNIASWSQVYGMLFAMPVSLMVWLRKRRVMYIALFSTSVLMLFFSQITFAVLLALVLSIAVYFIRDKGKKKIILAVLFALSIVLFLFNLDFVLTFMVNFSRNAGLDFLTEKLNDLKILLLNQKATGDAGARGELYQISLKTFLSYPLFGLIFSGINPLIGIGYHSELFDLLGTFGLLGVLVVFTAFAGYYRFLRNTVVDTQRELTIIFIGFIGLFVFNPVFNSPQIFVGAFLYPLLASKYCTMEALEMQQNRLTKITTR